MPGPGLLAVGSNGLRQTAWWDAGADRGCAYLSMAKPPATISAVMLRGGCHVSPKEVELNCRRDAVGPHGGSPYSSAHSLASTWIVLVVASYTDAPRFRPSLVVSLSL